MLVPVACFLVLLAVLAAFLTPFWLERDNPTHPLVPPGPVPLDEAPHRGVTPEDDDPARGYGRKKEGATCRRNTGRSCSAAV
jgi:hypothetical protein